MRTTIRTTIIGIIAACGLAAATLPAVSLAASPGHGGHNDGPPCPRCQIP